MNPHWTDCACGHPEDWHAGKDCMPSRTCGCIYYRRRTPEPDLLTELDASAAEHDATPQWARPVGTLTDYATRDVNAEAVDRVTRRADLRQRAAEHARATISREWLEHYAAQFLEPDRAEWLP